jgi:hypothetical protein
MANNLNDFELIDAIDALKKENDEYHVTANSMIFKFVRNSSDEVVNEFISKVIDSDLLLSNKFSLAIATRNRSCEKRKELILHLEELTKGSEQIIIDFVKNIKQPIIRE